MRCSKEIAPLCSALTIVSATKRSVRRAPPVRAQCVRSLVASMYRTATAAYRSALPPGKR